MTRNALVLCCVLALGALPRLSSAQDASVPAPGLDWYAFEEAVDLAKATKKKVLVDVYAAWCPWCRRLQSEVYTDEAVRAYVEEHFVLTRLDAENQEDSVQFKEHVLTPADLSAGLGAQGFPTTVFLDEESEYITRLPGFIEAGEFVTVLGYIGSEAFVDQTFEEYANALKGR
jgi:thioredoxin-related protein